MSDPRARFAVLVALPLLALALLAVALGGCGLRPLDVLIHAPADCDEGAADQPTTSERLRRLRSFETRIVRVDGTLHGSDCRAVMGEIADYDDLTGFVFLLRTEASDGVEVSITGHDEAGCAGELVLACESFGDAIVDLSQDQEIPVWCDCPRALAP